MNSLDEAQSASMAEPVTDLRKRVITTPLLIDLTAEYGGAPP